MNESRSSPLWLQLLSLSQVPLNYPNIETNTDSANILSSLLWTCSIHHHTHECAHTNYSTMRSHYSHYSNTNADFLVGFCKIDSHRKKRGLLVVQWMKECVLEGIQLWKWTEEGHDLHLVECF